MLTLTDEARIKIRERLESHCFSATTQCKDCIFTNEDCNFNIMEDIELLKCYHEWLDMIIHEDLLGE